MKRPTDFSAGERRLRYLLHDICTEWGYCLSPADADRIAASVQITAKEFALAILEAEGIDVEPEIVSRIAAFFIARIGSEKFQANEKI